MRKAAAFNTETGFCVNCGTVLPELLNSDGVNCYTCGKHFGPDVYGKIVTSYTVHFNSLDRYTSTKASQKQNEAEGPIVERKCAKCGNDNMSYTTLQLRSADEGQTIFYTCTKCRYKETENS